MKKKDFTKEIRFSPAYDKRNTDPAKDYGIHGVNLAFYLGKDNKVVQFIVFTNWQLPHVTKESCSRPYPAIGGDPHWMERPSPADLGYHSPSPKYGGQAIAGRECRFTGGVCYYDGSALNAEPVFEGLLKGGDKAVWEKLEKYWHETFGEGER